MKSTESDTQITRFSANLMFVLSGISLSFFMER